MKNTIVIIVVVALIFFAGVLIGGYNRLVEKDEAVNKYWAEVQNVYQRRLDLVPNLVAVVNANADYEKTTLQKIAEARAAAGKVVNADNFNKEAKAQDELATSTNRLIATIENYPQVQGTRAFKDLQVQLEGSERRIKFARKDFNASVASYNKSVRSFPASITAKLFGFEIKDGFSSSAGAENAVRINF